MKVQLSKGGKLRLLMYVLIIIAVLVMSRL